MTIFYIEHIPFVTVMCFDAANINVFNVIATKYHILISNVYLQKNKMLPINCCQLNIFQEISSLRNSILCEN